MEKLQGDSEEMGEVAALLGPRDIAARVKPGGDSSTPEDCVSHSGVKLFPPVPENWPWKFARYFPEQTVEISGTRLRSSPLHVNYVLLGNGPRRIVFISGLTATWRQWEFVLLLMKERLTEFTLLAYDPRGAGKTDKPGGRYTTKDFASDCVQLMDAVGWAGKRAHVVGCSLGGMIALELACDYPQRVASVFLGVAHSGFIHGIPPLRGTFLMWRQALHKDPAKRTDMYLKMIFSSSFRKERNTVMPELTNHEYYHMVLTERFRMGSQPFKAFVSQALSVVTHHVSQKRMHKLRETGVPALVGVATSDLLVRSYNAFALARQLGCAQHVFSGSGHAIGTERQNEFFEVLLTLIQSGEQYVAAIPPPGSVPGTE